MAIHVVYSIYKSNNEENRSYSLHDIVTHTDSHWVGKTSVSGGIRADLEREYPSPEYVIKVSHITSPGNLAE